MQCFHPLRVYRRYDGAVVFGCKKGDAVGQFEVPCGKCDGCRLDRSRQWAVRGLHELQVRGPSSFITLTYSDKYLPVNGSLVYGHFQDFVKRLRETYLAIHHVDVINWRVRTERPKFTYLMCGEYGRNGLRPHYHACLFGVFFDDRKKYMVSGSGSDLFTSDSLSRLWRFGFSSVGDVTFESIAYVARYTLKKVGSDVERLGIVDFSTGALSVKEPEFAHMSTGRRRGEGIGGAWWRSFSGDVKRRGDVVVNGKSMRPPRYYDKLLEQDDPALLERFKRERLDKVSFDDCTPERRLVAETVVKSGLKFKKRGLL